jgi:hypothetical protein
MLDDVLVTLAGVWACRESASQYLGAERIVHMVKENSVDGIGLIYMIGERIPARPLTMRWEGET